MAKGQRRGNREERKPKKAKPVVAQPVSLNKGQGVSIGTMKKKS